MKSRALTITEAVNKSAEGVRVITAKVVAYGKKERLLTIDDLRGKVFKTNKAIGEHLTKTLSEEDKAMLLKCYWSSVIEKQRNKDKPANDRTEKFCRWVSIYCRIKPSPTVGAIFEYQKKIYPIEALWSIYHQHKNDKPSKAVLELRKRFM